MEKEIAGIISIVSGVITMILCLLTLYVYPTLLSFKAIILVILALGFVVGLYLILLGYKFYTGKLPSMKLGSKMDGLFMIISGIIFMLLPVVTYLAGLRNPIIFIFVLGGLYYIFMGREIYRRKLSMSMKNTRFKMF